MRERLAGNLRVEIPDTQHLSSCHFLTPSPTSSPSTLPFAFSAPAISLGPRRPHHDTPSEQLLDRRRKYPSPVDTVVDLCALEVAKSVEHLEAAAI